MRKQKPHGISKDALKKTDPHLFPSTQNMENNLARGESGITSDPNDISGGTNSTLNQAITPRADKEQAEGYIELSQTPRASKK